MDSPNRAPYEAQDSTASISWVVFAVLLVVGGALAIKERAIIGSEYAKLKAWFETAPVPAPPLRIPAPIPTPTPSALPSAVIMQDAEWLNLVAASFNGLRYQQWCKVTIVAKRTKKNTARVDVSLMEIVCPKAEAGVTP